MTQTLRAPAEAPQGQVQIAADPLSSAAETLHKALDLDLRNAVITVCLASAAKSDDMPDLARLELTNRLAQDFAVLISSVIKRWRLADQGGDCLLHLYDPGSKPDSHEVEFIHLHEHEHVERQVSALCPPQSLPFFSRDEAFLSKLRFYALVVQPRDGEPALFFRQFSPKKELSRREGPVALLTGDKFDRIQDTAFLFDADFDCVAVGDGMLIFNKTGFQSIFRFYELVMATAKSALGLMKARLPIANFDKFEAACLGHYQMLAKVRNIAAKGYLHNISMSDIGAVISKHGLKVQTEMRDGQELLVFDAKNKWEILHLLDDDYLDSIMTGQMYEVSGKRVRKQA